MSLCVINRLLVGVIIKNEGLILYFLNFVFEFTKIVTILLNLFVLLRRKLTLEL